MKKILIVEDTEAVRQEMADILALEGFSVNQAGDGLEGLQMVKIEKPDLIVSDIMMPNMDGYEMLKTLQEDNSTFDIPLIFLSAKTENKDIRYGMELGAEDYLTKPLSPDELINAVKSKIARRMKINQKFDSLKIGITQTLPHELRTPLNGIMGFASILMDTELEHADVREMAETIFSSGERLLHIIENLLLYSKLSLNSSAGLKTSMSKTSVIEVSQTLSELIKKMGFQYNRILDVNWDFEKVFAAVLREDIEKILKELFLNAIKFSKKGNRINIHLHEKPEFFELMVFNEGVGMEKKDILKFGSFVQFNRDKMEQQGLGLGIALVKLLAEKYNGSVEFTSVLNHFFQVTVRIPI